MLCSQNNRSIDEITNGSNANKQRKKAGSKRWLFWGIVILLILVSILFVVRKNANSGNTEIAERLEEAISNEYAELICYDEEVSNPLITVLYEGFEAEVKDIHKAEEKYIADCTFSNFDFAQAFSSFNKTSDEMTYEEYIQELSKRIEEQPKHKNTVKLDFTIDEDGNYWVSFNEDQLDMAMGGFLTYYMESYVGG